MKSRRIPRISFLENSQTNSDLLLYFFKSNQIEVKVTETTSEADYIFLFPTPLNTMFKYCQKYKNKILIYVGGEAYTPDFNLFDYTFSYDNLTFGDRHLQIQFQALFCYEIPKKQIPDKFLESKDGFCNFIYANPKAHPNRDLFFNKLSEYKFVNSLGSHLKNTNTSIGKRHASNYFDDSVMQKSNYKFSISFENALHKGYNTEKIISSMCANSIPIYWGDAEINKYYNPKSFINCHDYNSFDEVIDFIKEVDNDDEKYLEILNQPWKTEQQVIEFKEQKNKFIEQINYIFSQKYTEAFRKPIGTFNNCYTKRLCSTNKVSKSINLAWKHIHHQAHLLKVSLKNAKSLF